MSTWGPYKSGWNEKTRAMETIVSNAIMKAVVLGFIGTLKNDWYEERWWSAAPSASCGHDAAPAAENGQSPCIRPSCPVVIAAKPKNATMKNETSVRGAMIFLKRSAMGVL